MAEKRRDLEAELELFERKRQEWVRIHQGEYVVICGDEVAGFYDGFESALRAALERFGTGSQFLVKQVWAEEPVFHIY